MKLVADASALLAVLLGETDAEVFEAKLLAANEVWISPVNWWEVQVRVRSEFGEAGIAQSETWMASLGVKVVPATEEHARIALAAFHRYRGRPHRLNLGDCFAYALAVAKDVPLLFKSGDFTRTGVRPA